MKSLPSDGIAVPQARAVCSRELIFSERAEWFSSTRGSWGASGGSFIRDTASPSPFAAVAASHNMPPPPQYGRRIFN